MTLNLAAIFGTDTGDTLIVVPAVGAVEASDADLVVAPDPVVSTVASEPWPIIEGTEHFSLWVDDPDGEWPEFIPGVHYDIRQPGRLLPLLSTKHDFRPDKRKTIAQNAPRTAPTGRVDV